MRITVFTPAYNRGYIIENLYRSLQRQTFHDFEWIVIDDGSTDNTEELFEKWTKEDNFFPIIYKKIQNGGKHRAINKGVKLANGELFFIVDSDDFLTDNSLEINDKIEKSIDEKEKSDFCGICGCRGFSEKEIIGSTYESSGFLDITALERIKYNIRGDKAEVFYTEVLKRYPFPEFDGEKFITECVVWDKMAADGYKLRFFNKITYICEYREDGLTAAGNTIFENSPKGWGLFLSQSVKYNKFTGEYKWDKLYHYWYTLHNDKNLSTSEIAGYLNMSYFYFSRKIFEIRALNSLNRLCRKFYSYLLK